VTSDSGDTEKTLLVGAPLKVLKKRDAENHLLELSQLVVSAGGTVVGIESQRISRPNPRFLIGKGKLQELVEIVKSTGANLVIFDDELTPLQGKSIEDHLKIRVMDRSELILDIFAKRARSREAKMQVELAQLQYLMPRLRRMWTHLSRIRGGIGLRGPGETQLESDRRLLGRRIATLRKRLESLSVARVNRRNSRKGEFQAALVGYTNAGKSCLLKALSKKDVLVEDRLFSTLDSKIRLADLGDGFEAMITDTVGFIRKLPHHLVASFRSTLEGIGEANLLMHVIDASQIDWKNQKTVVDEVLGTLDLEDIPQVLVFNKIDKLSRQEFLDLKYEIRNSQQTSAVFVSALNDKSLEILKTAMRSHLHESFRHISMRLMAGDGENLAILHEFGEILKQEYDGQYTSLEVRIPHRIAGRLLKSGNVTLLEEYFIA
jgi:GTP-binding protein HflX